MSQRKYDSTVARIAGNIAGSFIARGYVGVEDEQMIATRCVSIARAIVAETERTEPAKDATAPAGG